MTAIMHSTNFFQTDIKFLKGVGPQRADALYRAGVRTFEDFLNFFPRRHLDRTLIKSIAALREGEIATVVGEIKSVRLEGTSWKNRRLVVQLFDRQGNWS